MQTSSSQSTSVPTYGVHFDSPTELARYNMIQQQIRPWEVLDEQVLSTLALIKREQFVPAEYATLAFSDVEIPLKHHGQPSQCMFAPRVEARLLQELSLKPDDKVLEIGTGSGYMAALLSVHCAHVLSVEIDPDLVATARQNLSQAKIKNVTVQESNGFALVNGKYDAIVISGAVEKLPKALMHQLNVGGRMAVISGSAPVMSAQIITRMDASTFEDAKIFECMVAYLQGGQSGDHFSF